MCGIEAANHMVMTSSEIAYLSGVLDKCDAALADKPALAEIYDAPWRSEFRDRTLSAERMADVAYPSAYAVHVLELFFPPDYQKRINDGAAILLPKLCSTDRNHLVSRMRGAGCLSAEEELLLARGLAQEFGADAIHPPPGTPDRPRPEFVLCANGHEIDVEAKGLLESQQVQQLNECARRFGTGGWFTFGQVDSPHRLRAGLARKMLRGREGVPRIVTLTQYTPWLTPDITVPLVRQLAMCPNDFSIPEPKHALAIGYVCQRGIQGIWFNRSVQEAHGIDAELRERLRRAIRESFYPRPDSVFLDEAADARRERDLIARMVAGRTELAADLQDSEGTLGTG